MTGTARASQRKEHAGVVDTRRVRVGCEFLYVAAVDTVAVFQVEPLDAAPVSLARREWSADLHAPIRHYTDLTAIRARG